MAGIKESEPEVAAQLLPAPDEPAKDGEQAAKRVTPWRGFLRSGPVRASAACRGFQSQGVSWIFFC